MNESREWLLLMILLCLFAVHGLMLILFKIVDSRMGAIEGDVDALKRRLVDEERPR